MANANFFSPDGGITRYPLEDTEGRTVCEEEIHGVNLLKCTMSNHTINGVTFSVNNGVITLSGTSTGEINVGDSSGTIGKISGLKEGQVYTLNGCPANGGSDTYRLVIINENDMSEYYADMGGGIEFTAKNTTYIVYIRANSGVNLSNLVFKPMLHKADIEDSTYRPYNPQAIQNQLNAQGVLGAKNLLKYPYIYTTRTVNGMTYTDLGNGAVRATSEGATTGNADFHFAYFNESTLPKGKYYLSDGGASTNSVRIIVNKHNGSTYLSQLVAMDANHHDVEIDVDYDGYTDVRVLIWASTGATVNNLTFYPMLRLASDPDDTYQPYAMTNRELTENKISIEDLKTITAASSDFVDFQTRIAAL